jgi:hypothetical protein
MNLLSYFSCLLIVSVVTPIRYDGQSLVRISRSLYDRVLKTLPDRPWSITLNDVDIVVTNTTTQHLSTLLLPNETLTVLVQDLQKPVDIESARLSTASKTVHAAAATSWLSDYKRYDEIVNHVNALPALYPKLAIHVFPSIGKSVQQRDIIAFSISSKNSNTTKQTAYIQSLIHAREWITVTTLFTFCTTLLDAYTANNSTAVALLDKLQFVFVPVVNPDGYEYSWTSDRYWRKNMARYPNGTLYGVDLNRNFPTMWGLEEGSSMNPTELDYRGPSAASEPETQAIMGFFSSLNNVLFAIDIHSYSQLVLRPRYYTTDLAADDSYLRYLGKGIAEQIRRTSNDEYTNQRGIQLYKTSGDVTTYMRGVGATGNRENNIITFGLELSPSGRTNGAAGFVLDKSMIPTVGNGVTAGLLWLSQTASPATRTSVTWWLYALVMYCWIMHNP